MRRLVVLAFVLVLALVGLAVGRSDAARPLAATGPSWAVVNTDGSLARESGAVSSVATGTDGAFVVTFARDVSLCAYAVTGGAASSADVLDDAVVFTAAPSGTGPDDVFVLEYDAILGYDWASSGFHLIVTC